MCKPIWISESLKNRSVLIAPCRFTLPLRCGVQTVVASTSERQGWWWNNDITAMHKLASRQQSYFWHEKEYLNVTRIDHKKFHRGREKFVGYDWQASFHTRELQANYNLVGVAYSFSPLLFSLFFSSPWNSVKVNLVLIRINIPFGETVWRGRLGWWFH